MIVNNNKPINIIQYKYHEEEFGKLLSLAFTEFTSSGQQEITVFTKDKPVSLNREPLVVFSPFLRSILDSLPCCFQPSILLPDCSSVALQHLLNIVLYGATDFHGELNTAEILVAAKCLAIDLTNFEYVKNVRTKGVKETASQRLKEAETKQTQLSAMENDQSDSDLDETVADDYEEEIDEAMDRYRSTNLDDFNCLKPKAQGPNVGKERYDQETLDESPEDGLLTLHERYNHSSVSSKKVLKTTKKSSSITTDESKSPKFRIPKKKAESSSKTQEPLLLQQSPASSQLLPSSSVQLNSGVVTRAQPQPPPERWTPTFSSTQQGSFSQQIPLPNQTVSNYKVPQNYGVQPQQLWAPAMPVVPNQPFRQAGPPPTRSPYPGQIRAPLSQPNPQRTASVPPRLPNIRLDSKLENSFYTGQALPPTPRPQPQSMGLWAQSAGKAAPQSFISNTPVAPAPVTDATGHPDRFTHTPEIPPPSTTSTASINTCQLCNKTFNSTAQLWQHYARVHFFAELKADYGYMADIPNKSCNECGSTTKSVDALFLHIGTVHRKVNEIMEKRGLDGLKMPIVRSRKSM